MDDVLLLKVDLGNVELVHTNQLVLKDTSVFDLDADRIQFDLARMNISWFEEKMFPPTHGEGRLTSNTGFCRGVLGDANHRNRNFDKRVNRILTWELEVFADHHKDLGRRLSLFTLTCIM